MHCLTRFKQKLALLRTQIERLSSSLLVSLHLRKNREMLSYVIHEVKEKSWKSTEEKPRLIPRLWQKIVRGLFSKFETGLVFVIVSMFILWLLPLYEWMNFASLSLLIEDFKSFFLVLWQVQASILGITFVIIMFLVGTLIAKIESTYEKISGRIIREFLIVSKIYVILPFCLCSIIYIGMTILLQDTKQTYQNLALFLLNIASIFYLFYAAFNFFRPRSLEKLRLMHLKDEITKSINTEIDRRLSESVLIRQDRNFLVYSPFGVFDESSLSAVRNPTTKSKMIGDINLSRILSYSKIAPITVVKNVGSALSKDNDVLCYVPIGTDPHIIEAIQDCFVLVEVSEEVELSDALDGVQEEMREAIRNGNVTKLERVLDVYLSLLESFLEQTSAYNIHYDSKTARLMVDFGWRQIFRIIVSFEHAVEYAFRQGDLETISEIVYFPIKVVNLARQYGDHFLTQRFIPIFRFFYFLGSKATDARIANFAIDRSWRHLAEMSLHIHHLLESATEIERFDNLKDYLVEILLAFNSLLKTALDNKDFESFQKFGFALDNILKYFAPETSVFDLQVKLGNPRLSQEERSKLDTQLKLKKSLVEAKEKIEDTKKRIWFGLGAWITRLYREQKSTQNEFLTFFSETSTRFDNLEKISSTFRSLMPFGDVEFGWDFWITAEKPEGEVFSIDVEEWMLWFYCIQGIRLTPTSIGDGTPIVPSRLVLDRMENIKNVCNKIIEEPDKWEQIVLDKKIMERASNFVLLNQRASEQQTKADKQWLVEQELSERMCEDFKNEVIKAWKNVGNVRAIIEHFGNFADYDDSEDKCKEIAYFGFNLLGEKAAFVEGWHTAYIGFGQEFGRSLGNAENSLLLKGICSSLELYQRHKRDQVCQHLHSAIMKLRESEFNPNVIFIKDWETSTYIRNSERFKPKGKQSSSELDIVGCMGYFEEIPILLLHECPIDCCVVDIARLGMLDRCKLDSGSQPYVKISIALINDDLARSMIEKNPNLLKDEKGEDRSLETAIFDLKQKVHLKILNKVAFEIHDKNAGVRLEFEN